MCPVAARILAKQSQEAYRRVAGREAVYMTLTSKHASAPSPQLPTIKPQNTLTRPE